MEDSSDVGENWDFGARPEMDSMRERFNTEMRTEIIKPGIRCGIGREASQLPDLSRWEGMEVGGRGAFLFFLASIFQRRSVDLLVSRVELGSWVDMELEITFWRDTQIVTQSKRPWKYSEDPGETWICSTQFIPPTNIWLFGIFWALWLAEGNVQCHHPLYSGICVQSEEDSFSLGSGSSHTTWHGFVWIGLLPLGGCRPVPKCSMESAVESWFQAACAVA